MGYLFSQFWIFIALAALLGGFVGWSTSDGDLANHRQGSSNWLPWAVVFFLAGAFIALFKWVPGIWGLALEVALILFGAYIIGCGVGCVSSRKAHEHHGHNGDHAPIV